MPADDLTSSTPDSTRSKAQTTPSAPIAFAKSAEGKVSHAQTRLPQAPHAPTSSSPSNSSGNWIALTGIAFALLWLTGAGAYFLGYSADSSLQSLSPTQLGLFSILTVAPALLFFMSGLLGREVSRSSARSSNIDEALSRLSQPVEQAEGQVRTLSQSISQEIDRLNMGLESALARLAAMEEVIAHHADSLESASGAAGSRAEEMMRSLREERARLADVADGLEEKAVLIAQAIKDKSTMVAAAADLAEKQVRETEERIGRASSRLEGAGGEVSKAGDGVAAKLDERTQELKSLARGLGEQSQGLEKAYLDHCEHLSEAGEALRQEQERIAAAFDFHRAELEVMSKSASDGADSLKASAEESSQLFLTAVDDALARANRMADRIRVESKDAAESNKKALEELNEAAEGVRDAAERTAEALDYQASHARDVLSEMRETGFQALDDQLDHIKESFNAQADAAKAAIERLNETGFDAAQRSDEAFQARLREADTLTQKAAAAAETASETVRRQLADTLSMARAESDKIERSLEEMRERLHRAPDNAREVSQDMEAILAEGLERMNRAAIDATERAREIDDMFQARLRQNYELLSDFMLRMGAVAGGQRPLDLGVNEVPSPFSARSTTARPSSRTDDRDALELSDPLEDEPKPTRPAPETRTEDKPSHTRAYIRESQERRERGSSFSERAKAREAQREEKAEPNPRTARSDEPKKPASPEKKEPTPNERIAPTRGSKNDTIEGNGWRWKDLLANIEDDEASKKDKK